MKQTANNNNFNNNQVNGLNALLHKDAVISSDGSGLSINIDNKNKITKTVTNKVEQEEWDAKWMEISKDVKDARSVSASPRAALPAPASVRS